MTERTYNLAHGVLPLTTAGIVIISLIGGAIYIGGVVTKVEAQGQQIISVQNDIKQVPSRAEFTEMNDRLTRIENKLDAVLSKK